MPEQGINFTGTLKKSIMTEEQQNPGSGAQATESAGTIETPRRRRTTRTPRIGRVRRQKKTSESQSSSLPQKASSSPAPESPESPKTPKTPENPVVPVEPVVLDAVVLDAVVLDAVVPVESVPVSPESPQAAAPVVPAAPPVERPPQPPAPIVYAEGIVEVSGKGFGFLREARRNFTQSNNDIFVTPELVRKYGLRDGMWIKGEIRRGNRGPQMHKLTEFEGGDPDQFQNLPVFEELSVINPNKRIKLETVPERFTTRIIDLVSPVGKGQRGLIVAPPRTGKTTLLQHIADAVVKNHPEMKLLILLVDERPEEVTEIRRTVPTAELMASSNDSDIKTHTRIAQLCIDRARRLVEMGKDVFVLMDSLTRIGRAFNNAQGGGGRTMSGGVDARALEIPRKLFAAARNTEEAGSLTIMATALIETNSRMDELIFQEFKGTGNMEIVLDRKISDQRIYPAIDIFQSGTRREELLIPEEDLHKISVIRRGLAGHKPIEAIERLLFFIRKYPTNEQLLKNLPS